MEDACKVEALILGREAERSELALRAGDENAVADLGADLLGQIPAENDGRISGVGRVAGRRIGRGVKVFGRALHHEVEEIADGALVGGDDAFDEREAGARAAGDEYLSVESWRGGGDVRNLFEACEQRRPVLDAVGGNAHQVDVGRGAEQAVLQVAAHAVGDGQREDERGDACGHACDGDAGDNADHGLAALGAQIAGGDEEFEAHGASGPRWPR